MTLSSPQDHMSSCDAAYIGAPRVCLLWLILEVLWKFREIPCWQSLRDLFIAVGSICDIFPLWVVTEGSFIVFCLSYHVMCYTLSHVTLWHVSHLQISHTSVTSLSRHMSRCVTTSHDWSLPVTQNTQKTVLLQLELNFVLFELDILWESISTNSDTLVNWAKRPQYQAQLDTQVGAI